MEYSDITSKQGNKDKEKYKTLWMVSRLAGIIIIIFLVIFIFTKKSDYEIIFENIDNGVLTLEIIPKDTLESELININDEIIKKYDDTTAVKYIFYFDDKQHRDRFFELFLKVKLTDEEKKELSHNIAMYYYDKSSINKSCLTKRQSVGWKILKCY